MSDLRKRLQAQVDTWGQLGHPALIERVVLSVGVEFEGNHLPEGVKRGPPKMCFMNASKRAERPGAVYYEGYAMHKEIGFPFLHAWTMEDTMLVESTLTEPLKYEYMGIAFSRRVLHRTQLETGVYGLLCTDHMVNVKLLRVVAPAAVEEGLSIRGINNASKLRDFSL